MGRRRWWLIGILACAVAQSVSLYAQEEDVPNPNWIIFADELSNFIDGAQGLYDDGVAAPGEEQERQVTALMAVAHRVSDVYYLEITTAVRPKIESFLKETFESHQHLRPYFVLMGNAFVEHANALVEMQNAKNRKLRSWSAIGGTVLGLASGTAILYFKPSWVNGPLKSAMLVVGLGAAGGALGYGGGWVATSFFLPADPGVGNAKDFLSKYPAGEDFVRDIEKEEQVLQSKLDELEDL
ncbi:MAG: hypothetical protein COV44_09270 [Deltaproteobacteria bacterium CG11_big_fil_rev_8_21_14_0_20_45_16]|nr:MAG: hypothetical protein COV44_09270 [Deltaproteobacteria bacterium CG11_big_fil_rev_8_21_14_0_20_45_16]